MRATLARQARDFSGAEALCLGALLMLRDLEDATPAVARLRADALGLQARLYADLGRAGESVRVHREHVAARRAVVGDDPADLVARGELALALLEYAIEPAAQEEAKADILAAATEAVGHAELLTRTDPGNRRWEALLERASRDLTNATRRVSD